MIQNGFYKTWVLIYLLLLAPCLQTPPPPLLPPWAVACQRTPCFGNMMKHVFNGVRCVLVAVVGTRSVFVRLISGPGAGEIVLLPAIVFAITPEQSGLPFSIRRRQLPMIPAFAVTVHKAQGQTLKTVGLFITVCMFTHGQLYTALSRTRGWGNIRVFSSLPDPFVIRNCICAHVLR